VRVQAGRIIGPMSLFAGSRKIRRQEAAENSGGNCYK
jgi:hypothetical protein